MVRRSQDQTADTGTRSALIVAPHPDDETFGVGSTILRKRKAGARVDICVVSEGGAFDNDEFTKEELIAMRDKNLKAALARMDVPEENLHQLDFPDGGLPAIVDQVADKLAVLLREVRPDELFIPSGFDEHKDHVAVYGACCKAIKAVHPTCRIYTYPVWFWSWGSWHRFDANVPTRILAALRFAYYTFRLKPRTIRQEGFVEGKRELFEFYRWELRDDYDFFELWYLNDDELFFETTVGSKTKG
jgi:LmbE family N-acetylglucosaminyl deacetylase